MTGPDILVGGEGTVALVTGGGWNIGRAVARRLAAAGARVVVCSRNKERLWQTVDRITAAGGEAIAVPCDVTDPDQMTAVAEHALSVYGRIDLLVAAAGGSGAHDPVDRVDPREWHEVVAKNLFGTFHAARAVLGAMRRQQRGVILTFAGGGAFFPWVGAMASAYATAKAAVCRFTDQLQAELLDTPIRVNCIEPGMVWDENRLREVAEEEARTGVPHPERGNNRPPELAAELACFLASDRGASIRGRVVSVNDDWWRDPERVRAVESTVHLYRLRRADEAM